MDFKITSTTKRRACLGMTVIETLVATASGSMALAGAGALSVYTLRSFAAMSNYMELDKSSRNALDRMTQIIREADGVTSYAEHNVELSYHGEALRFAYSPSLKTLTMVNTNGTEQVLLEDCDFLNFQAFQRNSVPGSYDQYPATVDENATKLVQVSWVCSRSLIGGLLNSESVQSAKIVIRKQ